MRIELQISNKYFDSFTYLQYVSCFVVLKLKKMVLNNLIGVSIPVTQHNIFFAKIFSAGLTALHLVESRQCYTYV